MAGCGDGEGGLAPMDPGESYQAYLERIDFRGSVLVIEDGKRVLDYGRGMAVNASGQPNGPDTQFRIGSLTKPFTAAAMLLLQEDGALELDDTVADHLPDYPDGHAISLRALLTHTAGIPDYTQREDFASFRERSLTPKQLVDSFSGQPRTFEDGSHFEYSNGGYALLGLLVEAVSGQSYGEFVSRRVFAPLNMENSEYGQSELGQDGRAVGYTDSGAVAAFTDMSIPYAAGGLASSTRDLAKWHRALRGGAILSESSLDEMFTPHLGGYGLGWFIDRGTHGERHHHLGGIDGFRAFMARYPASDDLVVVLSNNQAFPVEELSQMLEATLH